MSSDTITAVTIVACTALAAKIWYDIVSFAYHRERMLVCRELVGEGVNLLRVAVERGALSDLAAASIMPPDGGVLSSQARDDDGRDGRSGGRFCRRSRA